MKTCEEGFTAPAMPANETLENFISSDFTCEMWPKCSYQESGMIRVLKSLLITVNSSYNELNEKLCILLCNCDNEITEVLST